MNITKTITTIIVALATVASALAGWIYSYSGVSDSPFPFTGHGSVNMYNQGQGQYGFAVTPGGMYGGYNTRSSSASFGYGRTGYNEYGEPTYAVTALNVRNGAVRGSAYRQTDGNYGGYMSVGSNVVPYPYYARSYYYAPYPVNYYGNSLYGR